MRAPAAPRTRVRARTPRGLLRPTASTRQTRRRGTPRSSTAATMEMPASRSEPNWRRTSLSARDSTSGTPPAASTTYNGSSRAAGDVSLPQRNARCATIPVTARAAMIVARPVILGHHRRGWGAGALPHGDGWTRHVHDRRPRVGDAHALASARARAPLVAESRPGSSPGPARGGRGPPC